ncbi:MAG: patatin-like phospholipase family protein [Burkholderiaceae bacterium]|nr:patatin-like phospholipase family protein [Burkholderiaceae bacterium]
MALQGGGSHGAFTWGVLDRLLEDERLEIAGISGTSAGAMNAVVLSSGLMDGGREGARAALRDFWQRVSKAAPFNAVQSGPFGVLFGASNPWMAPLHAYAEWLGRTFSPAQLNPLNLNPLRDVLVHSVDFERVRRCDKVKLFLATTHVRTGQLRIFRQNELTADIVLASACLPMLFPAVNIGGEAFWDGGYAGNPSLLPLITESPADDLLLVQLNPALSEAVPHSAREILDRIDEVTFNASLLKELRSIGLLKKLIEDEGRPGHHYRVPMFQRIDALRVHRLDAQGQLARLGAASKGNTQWPFLTALHDIGHAAADEWLRQNFRHLGRRSTFDLARAVTA